MQAVFFVFCCLLGLALLAVPPHTAAVPAPEAPYGIEFACAADGVDDYLASLGIGPDLVAVTRGPGGVRYSLAGTPGDEDTLRLAERPELALREEIIFLPDESGPRAVATVSKKEIVLALMQRGRLTRFEGEACSVRALRDHVGIRQNTAVWAEQLRWRWPDGRRAEWNRRYWTRGTPKRGVPLHVAVNDAFVHPARYRIGCYAASKLVMMQGLLDYYARVKPDPELLRTLEARLWAGGEPLEDVEPAAMWSFEAGFDPRDADRPGKIVELRRGVASRNFVPGDWAYFLNTDPATYARLGYEGSNAIYLGRGRFDDYYNDNHHAYTWREKVDEVYQWKNGVFSRSRHAARRQPLTEAELRHLRETPQNGGLLLDVRATPYLAWSASR